MLTDIGVVPTVRIMKRNSEPDVDFIMADQSISVTNEEDKIVQMKEDEHDVIMKKRKKKKRKNRKRKSEENETGCDPGKRLRKTPQEKENENLEKKKDMNVGNEEERKILDKHTREKIDDVELVIEDVLDDGFGDKLKTKKSGVTKGGLVQRFSEEEDEIIVKAILDYVEKHQLGENGVDMVINAKKHPILRGCWTEISAGTLPHRSKKSIYHRAQILFSPDCDNWTKVQVARIMEMHKNNEIGDTLKTKKSGVTKGGLVLGKRFSKEEDEIVIKAVLDYIEKYKLGEKGVDMVLNSKKHPILKGCWKEISAGTLPHRPKRSIYQRAQILFSPNRGNWTKEEIDYIMEMHKNNGSDWRTMAKKLGRYHVHVSNIYWIKKLPNRRKGKWSQEECEALVDLVHADLKNKVLVGEKRSLKPGMARDNISWTAISDKLGTRDLLDCCAKWYKGLSSEMVVDGLWADADDYRMLIALCKLDASCEDEVEWDSLIEHRTGDLCRKRWKQMVRGIGEHGSKSFVEQVEILSQRYSPEMLPVREIVDSRPVVFY